MTELKMEHVLILVIVAFMFYHFMVYGVKSRCSYKRESFNVGGQNSQNETSNTCSRALLDTLCFNEVNDKVCNTCLGEKQQKLRDAGCTEDDLSNYCSTEEECDKNLKVCKKTNKPCKGCHKCPIPGQPKYNCGCFCN